MTKYRKELIPKWLKNQVRFQSSIMSWVVASSETWAGTHPAGNKGTHITCELIASTPLSAPWELPEMFIEYIYAQEAKRIARLSRFYPSREAAE